MAERQKAAAYIKDHNIQDLFDYIQSEIIYSQPENPRKFIADLLDQIIKGQKTFYSQEEIDILFHKFEVLERGYITKDQCKTALKDIGINESIISKLDIPDKVKKDVFDTLFKESMQKRVSKWME